MQRRQSSTNPLLRVRQFYQALPDTEHDTETKKIIEDLPANTLSAVDWNLKQVQMLLKSIREAEKLDDAYVLFFKMFDHGDCRMLALRFYYLRWLLFAVQKDAQRPPFRTPDENFVFAKVAMLASNRDVPESVKKLLLKV